MEIQVPLVIFTLLLCLSNGLMGFQGYLMLKGQGSNRFHRISVIAAAIVLVVGGIAVFTHLQHWERIFNGFGHITSGITHELILVVVMVVALVAAFLCLRKNAGAGGNGAEEAGEDGESGEAGKVLEAKTFPGKAFGIAFIVIAIIGGFVTAHSYDMYARPAWNNIFLYLYYYSSELILGAAGIWTIAAVLKEPNEINAMFGKFTAIFSIVSAVVCIAGMFYIANIQPETIDGITFYTYDPTHAAADPASDLAAGIGGSAAVIFWLGAVVVGCVVPAIAAVIALKKEDLAKQAAVLSTVSVVAALIGGVCYRVVLYVVGIASYVYFF